LPQHAVDWIVTGGRFLRSVTASHLRKVCRRRHGECTWCGQSVRQHGSNRRTHWCSAECVEAFKQLRPSHVRRIVHARDQGRCSACGRECEKMLALLGQMSALGPDWATTCEELRRHWTSLGFKQHQRWGAYWEADHVVPVADGGGLATPQQMQTLCSPCHTLKTKSGASRRRASKQTQHQKEKDRTCRICKRSLCTRPRQGQQRRCC
jgi:hypothetical protein